MRIINTLFSYFRPSVFIDIVFILFSWFLSYYLRYNFNLNNVVLESIYETWYYSFSCFLILYFLLSSSRSVWKHFNLHDLKRIVVSSTVSTIVCISILVLLKKIYFVPRSVWILNWMILNTFLIGSRCLVAFLFSRSSWSFFEPSKKKDILIIGAGKAGQLLAVDFDKKEEWNVIGFVDDNKNLVNSYIYGKKIFGLTTDLSKIIKKFPNLKDIVLAIPSLSVRRRIELANKVKSLYNVNLFIMPSIGEAIKRNENFSHIKKIEANDLLCRPSREVVLNSSAVKKFDGTTCLITGAGGSIGSELVRQLTGFEIKKIILFERNEFAAFKLLQELNTMKISCVVETVIGDINDKFLLDKTIRTHSPEFVFHAAAYKHVPLMEGSNGRQAIVNNCLGTETLLKVCDQYNVKKFVFVSTDKAVNPSNNMGASKRVAEKICLNYKTNSNINISIVRFGNVLDSHGSVVPIFRDQINRGGPVTVTDKKIERFFMLIPEACQLILESSLREEERSLFVLDMGDPILIDQLARSMIKLSGYEISDINIKYTGLRPGEKLYEELFYDFEKTCLVKEDGLFKVSLENRSDQWWSEWLDAKGELLSNDFNPKELLSSLI